MPGRAGQCHANRSTAKGAVAGAPPPTVHTVQSWCNAGHGPLRACMRCRENAVCIDLEEYSLPGRCLRLCCRRARRKNSVAVQGVAVAAPRVAVPKAEKATRQLAVDSLEMQCGAGRSIHHKFFPENTVDQNTNSRLASHFGDLAALLCRFCKTCFQTCDTASKQGHVNGDFPKCRVP